MRKLLLALLLASSSGCTLHDALFEMFGDSYSGGGMTREEKRRDYDDAAGTFK